MFHKHDVQSRTFARVVFAVPFVVYACAAVLPLVTVARVISRIEHGCPPGMALRWAVREGARAVASRGDSGWCRRFEALRRATFRAWSMGTQLPGPAGRRALDSAPCTQ